MKLTCPHCGNAAPLDKWTPVERYYSLSAIARVMNTTPGYVRKWICTEPYLRAFPQIYRKDPTKRLHRMLPASMVAKMFAWRVRKWL
jgi:hypothetical protein